MNFTERFEKLEILEQNHFVIKKARYAKDKVAVSFISDGSGWKNSANLLFNELIGYDNYSNREHAYIVSISKVEKFLETYKSRN